MHAIANDGNTQPPRFRAAMVSSTPLIHQYAFDDSISEVSVRLMRRHGIREFRICSSKFTRTLLIKPG